MKISIVVWNLSAHSIVRTYPIAKVLERHYDIEVIGPVFEQGVYDAYRHEFSYKTVRPNRLRYAGFVADINELVNRIEGDVIYAFKAIPTSYGVGLLGKLRKRKPLVLDIEDWDAEPFIRQSLTRKLLQSVRYAHRPTSGLYLWLMEKLVRLSNQVTVASSFLQRRFGGTRLSHGADCSFFNPKDFSREHLRAEWGVQGKKVILFAGTVELHKGIKELIQAIDLLGRETVQLCVVGKRTTDLDELMKLGPVVRYLGLFPHSEMPRFLCMADLVVLPQRNTPYAQAQVPGKVFEAMAMAKPIIATRVSDLPEILNGCGWIVEPENPEQLAEVIQYVVDYPQEAEMIGWKAREKCVELYSWDAMEEILLEVFHKYE